MLASCATTGLLLRLTVCWAAGGGREGGREGLQPQGQPQAASCMVGGYTEASRFKIMRKQRDTSQQGKTTARGCQAMHKQELKELNQRTAGGCLANEWLK